jgi:nitroreductase
MKIYGSPITEVIQNRFSCRVYLDEPISPEKQQMLRNFMQNLPVGPLGTSIMRFDLIAAEDQDRKALRGLGTYGFIKGSSGFVVGAMGPGTKNLEDYGYRLEQIVLYATDLGLGTCWLGGTFTRSSFARKIVIKGEERLPAIVSIGPIADEAQARQASLRLRIGADSRLPWEALFFDGQFGAALTREKAGDYAIPLEMVRLGPSASNKQPWRIIQAGNAFHFYLQRTKGYRGGLAGKLLGIEDMQRVDLGIAMCHFELTARELGLEGHWIVQEPPVEKPDGAAEYSISWVKEAK